MTSNTRCKATTQQGTRCRRTSSEDSLYCKQHAHTLKVDTSIRSSDKRDSAIHIKGETGGPEARQTTNKPGVQKAPAYDHDKVCHKVTGNKRASDIEMGVRNEECEYAKNENIGNISTQNLGNSTTQQAFSRTSNMSGRTPISFSECHITIQNLITDFAPLLLDQARIMESLTGEGGTMSGRLQHVSEISLSSQSQISKLSLRDLPGKYDVKKMTNGIQQDTVSRLQKISSLLRRAAAICQETRWRDLFETAGSARSRGDDEIPERAQL